MKIITFVPIFPYLTLQSYYKKIKKNGIYKRCRIEIRIRNFVQKEMSHYNIISSVIIISQQFQFACKSCTPQCQRLYKLSPHMNEQKRECLHLAIKI